ncbi:MAG: hypothetical protein AAGB35_09905 [Pseudomonadota bacterium]
MSSKYLFIAILILMLLLGCASKGPLYAEGQIAGEPVSAEMDSKIAKYSLAPDDDEPENIRKLRIDLQESSATIPSTSELQYLVDKGSIDFATIILARALSSQENNRRWQAESYALSKQLDSVGTKQRFIKSFENHHALLIPGWHWKTRRDTGADLKYQRRALAAFGLQTTLVETNEHGDVEENALIIAQAINDSRKLNQSIVIISASKGGAETAYALGAYLEESQTAHVKGWLNIGGLIFGSTLVNYTADDPKRWLRSIGFAEDTPVSVFDKLYPDIASSRLASLNFPSNLTVVNFVGLPFASTVGEQAKYGYSLLASIGPNDGTALIQEMLMPNGYTVVEVGLDHFMRSRRAMARALSLLLLITECQLDQKCK